MRKFVTYILVFFPTIAFGQLFPSVGKFKGDIESVVEKHYGKDCCLFNRYTGINLPGVFSGWKYYYYFDNKNRLKRQINKFNGQVRVDYFFEYDSIENISITREIVNDEVNNHKGDCIEDEYVFDITGKVIKVNIWSYSAQDSSRKLSVLERNVEYDNNNRMISFTRHCINYKGDTLNGELYELEYDSLSQIIRIDEKAIGSVTKLFKSEVDSNSFVFKDIAITEPQLLRRWLYYYDDKGCIVKYKLEYYGEIYKLNKEKDEYQYFQYDKNKNLIKWYGKVGDSQKRLVAKRKIKYKLH